MTMLAKSPDRVDTNGPTDGATDRSHKTRINLRPKVTIGRADTSGNKSRRATITLPWWCDPFERTGSGARVTLTGDLRNGLIIKEGHTGEGLHARVMTHSSERNTAETPTARYIRFNVAKAVQTLQGGQDLSRIVSEAGQRRLRWIPETARMGQEASATKATARNVVEIPDPLGINGSSEAGQTGETREDPSADDQHQQSSREAYDDHDNLEACSVDDLKERFDTLQARIEQIAHRDDLDVEVAIKTSDDGEETRTPMPEGVRLRIPIREEL